MIFSRNRGNSRDPKKSGRHVRDERSGRHAAGDEFEDELAEGASQRPAGPGPYDVGEAPDDGVERLDLGALRIPAVDGVEVRVQASPEGQVQQVVLVHGDSALQLGVFAAPRTEGIWDDVRADIRKSLFADGVAAEEVTGEYGVELRARVRNPDGLMDIRFVGVDGPRWFVRGVYQGAAAVDPTGAGPLRDVMHGLIVDRGTAAMPVREALPLRLPPSVAAQAERDAGATAVSEVARPSIRLPGSIRTPDPKPADAETGDQRPGTVNGSRLGGAPRRKPSPRPRRGN